ncbi:MAG: peptidyl-prolyl cis-trans isomerase, partial [Frankiaceae bacterium]|nr:peptidyl-prolyl cis-trans isomerase [Frankiaceae bacterium]
MAQSREQARLAERRRQERRAARQAESLHQRKVRSVIGAVVAIALLIGGVVWISIAKSNNNSITPGTATSDSASPTDTSGTAAASGSPSTTAPVGVACGGTVPTAAAPQTFKAEPPMTVNTKAKYVATLKTSCGTIDIAMDAAKTPHTVNSWAFLAAKGYWDGTRCHRMTSGTLNVLQCGDPTGSG